MATSKENRKVCPCGTLTAYGQTLCHKCASKAMREDDLQPRLDVQAKFKLQGTRGQWPTEREQWIELQMLHQTELPTYLRSRSQTRQVWPATNHSLSCWMDLQRNKMAECFCGAEWRR